MVSLYENPKNPKGLGIGFPYSPENVKVIKQVLGVAWDPKLKMWVSEGPEILLDLERFGIKIASLSSQARKIAEAFRQQLWDSLDLRALDISGEQYAYQGQGSSYLQTMQRAILGDEMGLGKTKQSLDGGLPLGNGRILVLCEKTTTYNWLAEIEKWHPGVEAGVVPQEINTRKVKGVPVQGRKDFWKDPPQIVIANYEKLYLAGWPFDTEWDVVIGDEATRFKNSATATYHALKKIVKKTKYGVWPLTGTPMEKRIEELYNIMALVRPAVLGNFMRFREQHMEVDWAGNVVGVKNLPLLRDRIGPFLLRRTKAEVLPQLPPKLPPQNVFVQMSPQEEAAYEAFTDEFNNWLTAHGVSGAGNAMVQTIRMRQFTCTPMLFTNDLGKGSKYDALLPVIEGHEGQIIIFCSFKQVVHMLMDWLKCNPRATIHGDVPAQERKQREVDFNAGILGKIMICTDAGQKGLNFVGADMVIHYDQIWNAQKMAQREDRLHRIGQTLPVQVINMMNIGTIDYGMYLVNREEEKLFESIIEGAEEQILRKLDAPRLRRIIEGKSTLGTEKDSSMV